MEPDALRPVGEPRLSSSAESGGQSGLVPADPTSAVEPRGQCPVEQTQVPPAEATVAAPPEVVVSDPSLYQAILATTDGAWMMELFRRFM